MDVHDHFEKRLDSLAMFNGVCLNIEEKIKLEIALNELHNTAKMEELVFWGKITGEDSDYYIAQGINYKGFYEFPQKLFYYAASNFVFAELPKTLDYHDQDFVKDYSKPLKGNPDLIIRKYKEDIPEGEQQPGSEPQDPSNQNPNDPNAVVVPENAENAKPLDPDASTDDNAPKKEEPKENFTEKLKLSYIVRAIDYDTNVVPQGALRIIPEHEIRKNQSFKGLKPSELRDMNKFHHFRPISQKKRNIVESDDAIFIMDFLDSIDEDPVHGCWSIQLDSTKTVCNLRSLLWPGYFAVHKSNSDFYFGCYFGNGMKNAELPFMI